MQSGPSIGGHKVHRGEYVRDAQFVEGVFPVLRSFCGVDIQQFCPGDGPESGACQRCLEASGRARTARKLGGRH